MISYQFLIDAQLRPDKAPDFSAYPFRLPAVRHLGRLEFDPAVTFIFGENGSGKSTLLEALAVALGFNAEAAAGISTSTPASRTPACTNICALGW